MILSTSYPHQADGKRSSNVIEWNIIQNIGSSSYEELFLKNGKNWSLEGVLFNSSCPVLLSLNINWYHCSLFSRLTSCKRRTSNYCSIKGCRCLLLLFIFSMFHARYIKELGWAYRPAILHALVATLDSLFSSHS